MLYTDSMLLSARAFVRKKPTVFIGHSITRRTFADVFLFSKNIVLSGFDFCSLFR